MPGDVPSFRSHLTLGLITLLHMFTHMYGTVLVPLYIPMRDDLGLGGVGAASLIVSLYTLVYCVFSYPAGVLADRWNRKTLLGVGLLVNALAILLMGLTRRYEFLVLLGVLGGLAGTLFHPAANALSTAHYPKSPGMAIGVVSTGAAIGFFLGPRYAGWRAEHANWQTPLIETGLFGVVCGVLFLLIAKEARVGARSASPSSGEPDAAGGRATQASPLRVEGDAGVAATKHSGNGDADGYAGVHRASAEPAHVPMGRALRWRMTAVALLLAGRDFAGIGTITLTSLYLQKARGYTVAQAGLVVGSMMLVAVIANPLSVYLSPGRRRLPVLFGILVGGAAILMAVPFVSVGWVLPVLCLFQACHLGSYAVSEAAMLERVDPAVRGRVIGLFLTFAGTLASIAPWMMGAWTDALNEKAYDASGYVLPFGLLALLMVYASGCVFMIRRLGPTPTKQMIEPMREISPATMEVTG